MSDNKSARELFDLALRQYAATQKRIDGRVANLWKIRLAAWGLLVTSGSFSLEHPNVIQMPAKLVLSAAWLVIGIVHMFFEQAQEARIAFERPRALAWLDNAEGALLIYARASGLSAPEVAGTHALQPALVPRLRLWALTYVLAVTLAILLFAR